MFILYVADQGRSRDFYRAVLGREPELDVPGMTEFKLTESSSLGLMPEKGIHMILGDTMPHPQEGSGIPRAELYLFVPDPAAALITLVDVGGKSISTAQLRNWGDTVAYGADPDGHVIAFAERGGS